MTPSAKQQRAPASRAPASRRARRLRHACACAVLLVLAAVAGAGCGAAQRETEPLDQSVRVYNEGVRWQRFDDAASRLPAERRDDFLDQRDQLHEDLRISDYEIIRVRYDGKQRRARVQVKYTWYLESRGVVHETHTVQTWHRGDEIWVLRGERHLRGEIMPGVEESTPETEIDTEPEAKPEAKPKARPKATIDTELETDPETNIDTGPETNPDAPSESWPEPTGDDPGEPVETDPELPPES